jgi:hypothetical protein
MNTQIDFQDAMEASPDLLVGLDQIATYISRSKPTTRILAEKDNLPAVRVRGRWMSSKTMLDSYVRDKLKKRDKHSDFTCPSCP